MCAVRPMAARRIPRAITDFNQAIQLNPRFYQAYANRALVNRNLATSRRRSPTTTAPCRSTRTTTSPISAAAISTARSPARRGLQRFQQGDQPRYDRPARLSQSRPDLSVPQPARPGDRGLLQGNLALAVLARALQRPRHLLPGAERRRQRLLDFNTAINLNESWPKAGRTRPSSTSGAERRKRPSVPIRRPCASTPSTSLHAPVWPASRHGGLSCHQALLAETSLLLN